MNREEEEIIRKFSKLYYDSHVWLGKTKWLGVATLKNPTDLWAFQEIIFETQPDVIIETGTNMGGSALYMACILDYICKGKIITIDIADIVKIRHKRVTYLIGSSTDTKIVDQVKDSIPKESSVMVILDSDHSYDHVLRELEIYHSFVSPGKYLIVEDTNIGEDIQPTHVHLDKGPKEAVEEFLSKHKNFEADHSREKFLSTFDPGGFLVRKE